MVEPKENPLIDTSSVTVSAFNILKEHEKLGKSKSLGKDETIVNTIHKSTVVYVYTPQDKQKHRYFHSLSIDKQVEDFMGTAELRCPYDSDLMEYWEPIRNYCIIYGSNHGEHNAKILFIGRVRAVKQEGYELVIQFQDAYWKFKQMVTQSYANDNVINKDGYTIMKIMFAALKIDSWVISPAAKYRLKQVGYDKDGNLTLNKKKVEEMPDLLKRLKYSKPNKAINKWTLFNKAKESKVGNIKNINYTLKYEKPTPIMKKISSEGSGDFTAGKSLYGTNYGAASSGTAGGGVSVSGRGNSTSASGHPRPPEDLCSSIPSEEVRSAMKLIWSYQRDYTNNSSDARTSIINFARNKPATYSSTAAPCLSTMSKYCTRKDGYNAAWWIKIDADAAATVSGFNHQVAGAAIGIANSAVGLYQGMKKEAQKNPWTKSLWDNTLGRIHL